MVNECRGGCLGTRIALNSKDAPYCLRAIENDRFNSQIFKVKGKMDTMISKYKNIYSRILNIKNL